MQKKVLGNVRGWCFSLVWYLTFTGQNDRALVCVE